MADNLAHKVLMYALLFFFVVVVVFFCYAMILHTEQSQIWSTIKDRGASRTMPNGTTNYWYYIVRETPYEVSELLQCKTVLRRNKPTFFNISLHVPEVLNKIFFQVKTYYRLNDYQEFPINVVVEVCAYFRNPSEDIFSRHLLSIMFETVPHLIHYCPHGNKTYTAVYWLEDKFFPKSMPAGDYRQDVWFRNEQNKTMFAYQAYFSVRRMGIWRSLLEW